MLSVPFENLDIHLNREIVLNIEYFFDKIVNRNRGGFCYELNGLFFALLSELGYDCNMISARVKNKEGGFNPEFDHMAIIVKSGERYLADVGFGDSFIEPLKLVTDLEQMQKGIIYKIVRHDNKYLKLTKSWDGTLYEDEYIFTLEPRTLDEYSDMCEYHQTSSESHFTQNSICSMPVPDGRITLSGMKFISSHNGERSERLLKTDEEYNFALKKFFNIEL
jgi:N-hydroxyarylamine O-acetyltransferase